MSSGRMPKIIADNETVKQFMYATVNGRLIPRSNEDYMKLCLLAYRFKQAVKHGVNLVLRRIPQKEAYKELAKILPSSIYGETAYKYAKLVEGARNQGQTYGNEVAVKRINIRRNWIASRGGVTWKGNLNIRLVSTDRVMARYYNGEWLEFKARFGKKYIPLLNELIELSNQKKMSYGIAISFRDGKVYVHVEVPMWLYLKYFSTPRQERYGLIAGFDINSDRLNVVVINRAGDTITLKTFWYSKVVSHGFSKEKARWIRLNALSSALK